MAKRLPVIPPEMVDPSLPGGYFSHSKYQCYKICGRRFYFKYVQKIPGIGVKKLVQGRAIHSVVEQALLRRKEKQAEWTVSELSSKLSSELDDAAREDAVVYDVKDKEASTALLRAYCPALTKIQPVEVELPFVKKVADITVVGFIDLVDRQNGLEVVEVKTSAAKWSQKAVDKNPQLTLYAAVTGLTTVRVDNLVSTKTPAVHQLSSTRTSQDVAVLEEDYAQVVASIRKGDFPMAPIDSWQCDADCCEYWDQCRGAKK